MADTIINFTVEERLKLELEAARRKGVIKSGESGVSGSARACARCRAELGRIINRGAFCRWCRHKVCKNCREYTTNQTSDWLCTVCFKHMELTAASGEWMNQYVRRSSKRRDNRITAVETVKRSLQRSWTFSDASPSPWAALRNSPEMRAYSSMPRHRDCEFITRTAFTNRLNLTNTTAEPNEQSEQRESNYESTIATHETDPTSVDEKVPDPEQSLEENMVPVSLTDNESSIGSPATDKRTVSESTSLEQSDIGSPITEKRYCHESPSVSSSGESPLVEKRSNSVIEPLTGTVFRKVSLKKRRIDTRHLPPGVTPPRSRRTLHTDTPDDDLTTTPDDYKLVFISSSDSSSREELVSDAGSECDWDYFEPSGVSPLPLPPPPSPPQPQPQPSSVVPHQSQCERHAACVSVPVPIPVPIPVPVPVLVPVPWTPPPDLTIRIQHLWSMQQLVTVTLGDQMSHDLRLAALKHFQDLVNNHNTATVPSAVDTPSSVICKETFVETPEVENSVPSTKSAIQPPSQFKHNDILNDINKLIVCGNIEIVDEVDRVNLLKTESESVKSEIETVVVDNSPNNLPEVISEQPNNLGLHISEDIETDGVILKNYKKLDNLFQEKTVDEPKYHLECVSNSMEESRDDESECSSTSSEGDKPTKRSYKLNSEEGESESEGDSSEDEDDSSGEFSGGSSLSSSPGSGRFKRVYVVNDSDSDLGELPESQVNDEEEGEVTLIRHENINMDEIKLSTILQNTDKQDIPVFRIEDVDNDSIILQDSLECNVQRPELDLPESDYEAVLSLPVTTDKIPGDNAESASDVLNTSAYDYYGPKSISETDDFLSREIKYCEKIGRPEGAFVLERTADGSDEECGKVCETRGSNTSDEFSGTESMELEQGQIRAGGPVSGAAVESSAAAAAAAGRYTSLVMITQDQVEAVNVVTSDTTTLVARSQSQSQSQYSDSEVHVVTGNGTTAVVNLEDGLPDDDSWVEELDRDEPLTTTEESSEDDQHYVDREEELRGYNRPVIDFTLHTIVEESCEESEVEMERNRPTELEKYFFYGVGDGLSENREIDTMSETSSIHSEGLESLGGFEDGETEGKDPAELASSRLEKYFLSGILGCSRRDSDGSVGSDSEGKPSPEQRRKRLVRARGTGRQHSSSQDNLHESDPQDEAQPETEGSSTETDSHDDLSNSFEKSDGQFDTVKRTKKKKRSVVSAPSLDLLETPDERPGSGSKEEPDSEDGNKTPQPEFLIPADLGSSRNKQQSRDSGFMGSCDDLLKEKDVSASSSSDVPGVMEAEAERVPEISKKEETVIPQVQISTPTGLIRKDSFNNWSSDEETNLMMSKMRQFFKTMVASQKVSNPTQGTKSKPPQLLHFESELTRLMKTVPGIRDEQVKEIVEYLSSEDTWSDSYDSSDYTSSDLEGGNKKTALQEEISASCRQIISNFEAVDDPSTSSADVVSKDTAIVYQRLVASFSKLDPPSSDSSASHNSPPLIAKVMQHIGSRLVALMHEVSSAEGGSPKTSRYHRRLQHKLSNTSTTEDEEDSIEDYSPLPRSKSHDPLIEENRQEASDNERFSWRGSFESALMASDSRQRLSSTGEASASASALALAAKRRSAGDLLFKTSSREQLDRVRSCGSIGGSVEDKIWGLRHQKRRRSSVPDSGGSNDGDDDSEEEESGRSTTLPRSLQSSCTATNSLPRLPTTPTSASPSIYKAHSVHQVSASKSVVSARYRPPGYNSRSSAVAPPRRDTARRRAAQTPSPCNISSPPSVVSDDVSVCSESVSVRTPEEDDRLPISRSSLGTGSPLFRTALHHDMISSGSNEFSDGFHKLKARSDSLASVYSGAGEGRYGSVAVRGEVEFGLQYNYKQGALEIYVKQCRDLAAVDTKRNRSDPYVKVYLLPDKSKSGKRKTRVKKHTLNPVFEETLKFHITLEGLESRTLWLSVWHSDMFGRNDFLGEVTMALENKVFDDPLPKFYTLQERTEPLEELLSSRGELIVGLKFVPPENSSGGKKTKGCLQVLVKEAKNLAAVKSNGTSDPFCKSYLLPDKGRSSKQKTPVVRKCCSPAWNHTFTYQGLTLEDLSSRSLELTIWDHDRLASNEFLGGVRLNLGTGKHNGKPVDWMDASGKETTLWQRMLERPNLWVESCLSLRPSLDVRNNS